MEPGALWIDWDGIKCVIAVYPTKPLGVGLGEAAHFCFPFKPSPKCDISYKEYISACTVFKILY